MKTKFLAIGLLLGVSSAVRLHSLQQQRDDELSAIDAAIDAAEKTGEPEAAAPEQKEEKPAEAPQPEAAELPQEEQPKKDEVEELMAKYDNVEVTAKTAGAEAKKKKAAKDKKDKEDKAKNDELAALEQTIGNLNNQQEREQHFAEDDDFLQGILTQYAVDGPKGQKIVSKDKAYIAAGKCIEKFRGIKGSANQTYLKTNFAEIWAQYDVKGKNRIEESEAYQMFKEI